MKIIDVTQGENDWFIERLGCVTGTRFQQAVGAKYSKANDWELGDKAIQFNLLCELVSERQSENEIDDYVSPSMERGNLLEPLSIEAASRKRGINFQTCGMLQCDWHPRLKFSPDAIYIENNKIVGGYETKSKQGKKHIMYTLLNEVPHEHFWQCIAPMIMDDSVQWWDFGHYDDRNFINDLFITRMHRKDVEWMIKQARPILKAFLLDVDIADKKIKSMNEDII